MTRSKKSIYKNQVIYWLSRTQSWNEVHTNNDRAEKITLWNKCVNLSDIGRILTFPIIRINYCKLQGLSISASTALSLTASFTPTLWCWMSTAKFASGNHYEIIGAESPEGRTFWCWCQYTWTEQQRWTPDENFSLSSFNVMFFYSCSESELHKESSLHCTL